MPDKWEYPWFAAWDLAFHCMPLALIDREFAKRQLVLLTREWYMHPNGQLPAYEWAFGDVNPPVHAWAAWRVFQIDRKQRREPIPTTRRPGVSRTRLPQADAEFHLVGESQGRAGAQHFPGRLSWPRQHRRLRPQQSAADRRLHQPGRRHQLDGDVLPEPDAHRRSNWRCTTLSTRTSPPNSSSIPVPSPARSTASSEDGSACGTKRTSSTTTSLCLPDGTASAVEDALDRRTDSAVRRSSPGAGGAASMLPEFTARMEWFLEHRPKLASAGLALAHRRARRPAPAVAAARSSHEGAAATDARRNRVPVRLRRARAVEGSRAESVPVRGRRHDSRSRLLAGGVPQRTVRRQLQLARADLDAGQLS